MNNVQCNNIMSSSSISTHADNVSPTDDANIRMVSLSPIWKTALNDYEFIKLIGVGSYGEVVHAKHRASGKEVAIKKVNGFRKYEYEMVKVLREI